MPRQEIGPALPVLARRTFNWSAEPVDRTPLSRPAVVQMDTVPASYCQVRHRSSYGCAAPARNATGFDSAFTRRFEPGSPTLPALMFACSVLYPSRTFLMTCCAAWAPRPRIRISPYACFRVPSSRAAPGSNAPCATRFAAPWHPRGVAFDRGVPREYELRKHAYV